MPLTIAILSSGHPADDERIYYKIAQSLAKAGHEVTVLSTLAQLQSAELKSVGIKIISAGSIGRKFRNMLAALRELQPDIIIASEIFPVFPAYIYKKQSEKKVTLIQDVTEWYPENIARKKSVPAKWITYTVHFFFLVISCILTNAFLFGEARKFARYHVFAPRKKAIEIGYYPHLLPKQVSRPVNAPLTLCYSGILSEERGFPNFLRLLEKLNSASVPANYRALIIGRFPDEVSRQEFQNLRENVLPHAAIDFHEWTDYATFLSLLAQADVCLDLREQNYFFTNSLPIKLFDYLAAGKPIIFSNLEVLQEIFSTAEFGFLVEPSDTDGIVGILEQYSTDRGLLRRHGGAAGKLADTKYNWDLEEKRLIEFIDSLR